MTDPTSLIAKELTLNHEFARRSLSLFLAAGMLLCMLFLSRPVAAAGSTNDEFIRGYAAATLQRDFQITAESLKVQSGVIYIQGLEASM